MGKTLHFVFGVLSLAGMFFPQSSDAQTIVYSNDLSSQTKFSELTVVDYNGEEHTGDQNTWQYNEWGPNAYYRYSDNQAADDWLITPSIALKKGYEYTFSFGAKAQMAAYPEAYSVLLGQGVTLSEYSTIKAKSAITNTAIEEQEAKVKVDKDGNYRFAIRCQSDAGMATFTINNIKVVEGAKGTTPGHVTDLKAEAAAQGALSATISFKAPSTTTDGTFLSSLTKITVKKGEDVVGTIDAPEPGSEYSISDANAINGWNRYDVIASNTDGDGEAATDSAFVGIDTPLVPVVSQLADGCDGTATLTWTAPNNKGVEGGYVDASALAYTVYHEDSEGSKCLHPIFLCAILAHSDHAIRLTTITFG